MSRVVAGSLTLSFFCRTRNVNCRRMRFQKVVMQITRHMIALISAVSFVLSTLTWWGHHALNDAAHHGARMGVEAAPSESHDLSHSAALEHKSAHKHHEERKNSDPATASCCVATCVAAMPAAEPDMVCGERVGQSRHVATPEYHYEATIAREDRPPRTGRISGGPFGPAIA